MNKTIHELNSLAQAQADDELIIYDVSEGESKKIQVQALNNPNYSTTEQKTGGTWIDGKPIYRKVIMFNSATTIAEGGTDFTLSALGLSDIDNFFNIVGFNTTGSKTNTERRNSPIGCFWRSATTVSLLSASGVTSNYLGLIVEYTKTTD